MMLFRPSLQAMLVRADEWRLQRAELLSHCMLAIGLHQRIRTVTALGHVMSLPLTELWVDKTMEVVDALSFFRLLVTFLLLGTGGFSDIALASLPFLSFVVNTCATLYGHFPTAPKIISNLRQFLHQVALQSQSPGYVFQLASQFLADCRFSRVFERCLDVWIGNLENVLLPEMLMTRDADYWFNFSEALRRRSESYGDLIRT